ncbi:MAG: hypothetical protein WA634_18315, partial [Silvibacterium sp.]
GYQFSDDLNWNRGNHNIKIGWTIRRDNVSDYSPSEFTGSPEAVAFNNSFQQGQVDEWVENFPTHYDQSVALYAMGGYIQDQWKPMPNLTLTVGLRLEHGSNPTCANNCFARLPGDFSNTTSSPDAPYQNILTYDQHVAFKSLQKVGYEPRVGFAYLPGGSDSKTTVRGGFGMFSDSFPGQIADSFLNNPPTNIAFTLLSSTILGPPSTSTYALIPGVAPNASATQGSARDVATASSQAFSSGFAHGATFNSLSAVPGFSPPSITTAAEHINYPTYEEWSLTLERELTPTVSLSVGYVGNHTYHQPIVDNSVNAFGFGSLPAGPNPNFGAATQVYSAGGSNYNGLITSLVDRSRWLTLQLNYSYSHALDDVSNGGFDGFGANSENPSNPNISLLSDNYGNADYDTRHYVSGAYVITVPHWGGPRALTDGWKISGTTFHNTGYPFSVTANAVASGIPYYGGPLYAQQIAPITDNHCGGAAHSAFAASPVACSFVADFADPTGFGQGRRNSMFGSSYTDSDLSLAKNFQVPGWESAKLTLAIAAYNVFNHPNFAQANGNIDSGAGSFGLISGTVNTPTSILGSFLGGDASPRLMQTNIKFSF